MTRVGVLVRYEGLRYDDFTEIVTAIRAQFAEDVGPMKVLICTAFVCSTMSFLSVRPLSVRQSVPCQSVSTVCRGRGAHEGR
jgi:hypothetical protein